VYPGLPLKDKEDFSQMIKRLVALTAAVVLLMAVMLTSAGAISTMFVYTENGRTLNVRSAPTTGDNVIGHLAYGAEVGVEQFLDNGWCAIVWGSYGTAYVQSRFLQWYEPGPKPTPRPTSAPAPSGGGSASDLAALNKVFRSARVVTPYTISVRPARVSGWVNMRWAPTTNAEVISNYKNGAQLTVIAELNGWYQVEDPSTGYTGFMMSEYTSRLLY